MEQTPCVLIQYPDGSSHQVQLTERAVDTAETYPLVPGLENSERARLLIAAYLSDIDWQLRSWPAQAINEAATKMQLNRTLAKRS